MEKILGKLAEKEKPTIGTKAISRRVLVQTNFKRIGMGYWDELYQRWETEFVLGAREEVVMWADAEMVADA